MLPFRIKVKKILKHISGLGDSRYILLVYIKTKHLSVHPSIILNVLESEKDTS